LQIRLLKSTKYGKMTYRRCNATQGIEMYETVMKLMAIEVENHNKNTRREGRRLIEAKLTGMSEALAAVGVISQLDVRNVFNQLIRK